MRQGELLHQSSSIFSSGEMTSPFTCSSARRNATPTCTTIQKKHQWIKWKLCTKNGEGIGENWCWSFFFTWQKRVIRVFLTAAEELTPHPSNPFEPSKNPTIPCLRKHIVSDPTSKDNKVKRLVPKQMKHKTFLCSSACKKISYPCCYELTQRKIFKPVWDYSLFSEEQEQPHEHNSPMHLPHNFLHSCFCCHHWTFLEAHYQCCSKNRDQPRLQLCETKKSDT